MAHGNTSQTTARKLLPIAAAIIVIIVAGTFAVMNSNKKGADKAGVSVEEATKAREKGLEFYKKGEWDSALVEFEKAVEGNPKDLYAQTQLAYAYERKGELDKAFKQYEAILKINKESADAHYNMGRILVQKKELDKAIAELETAAEMNPNFTAARADLARAYVEKEEFNKALGTYGELEKIISNDAYYLSRIYSAKGNIYKQLGQRANAKAMFTKALELDSNNKEGQVGLSGLAGD